MFVEPEFSRAPVTVAVDVGYSATKYAFRDRGVLRTGSFQSVASRSPKASTISDITGIGVRDSELVIEVNRVKYVVDTSESELVASSVIRTELDSFPASDEYAALVYASLVKCGVTRISRLILGLPYHTYDDYASVLIKKFRGLHNFELGALSVESVSVLPQPVGAFVYLRATHPEELLARTSSCVIDCGWGTTDVFVSSAGFKIDPQRCGGLSGGAAIVLREIAALLRQKYHGRLDNLDRIDYCIVNGQPLLHKGEEIDLLPFLSEALHVTRPIARAVLNTVGTVEDLTILISGGAAHYYAETLRETLGCRLKTVDQPRYANVIGFLIAGEAAAGGRR